MLNPTEAFNVTLFSQSGKSIFPNNRASHWSTKLHLPIHFEGEWEVALQRLDYTHMFSNVKLNRWILFLLSSPANVVLLEVVAPKVMEKSVRKMNSTNAYLAGRCYFINVYEERKTFIDTIKVCIVNSNEMVELTKKSNQP